MELNDLFNVLGSKKKRKRICRGIGSGMGKTGGRGGKGQTARSGVAIKGFEGGQTSLIKRLPKIGFNPLSRTRYTVINLSDIAHCIDADLIKKNDIINKELLLKVNLIHKIKEKVKLLGDGEIKASLEFNLDKYSESAKEKILKSGGKCQLI